MIDGNTRERLRKYFILDRYVYFLGGFLEGGIGRAFLTQHEARLLPVRY